MAVGYILGHVSKRVLMPDADLGQLANQAASTARSHLGAAKCLLESEFWPQAYAFAAFAFEEAGKSWMVALELLSPEDLRERFPFDFGRDHVRKLSAAYSMLTMLRFARAAPDGPPSAESALASLGRLAREAHESKLRGLYTDYRHGTVRSPGEVTEQEARRMVAAVEEVLDTGGWLVDLATAMWARDALPEEARSFLMRAAEAAKSGEAAIEAFMQRQLSAIEPIPQAFQLDTEVLQQIKDDPEWIERILRAASGDSPQAMLDAYTAARPIDEPRDDDRK
jgi:AbiV family abortive infection protein